MRFFLLLLFTFNFLAAQKVVKKSMVDRKISSFQIDVSNCFEVHVGTADTDEIVVEATIDGEYKKDLLLNVKEEGTTVMVDAGFQPNFENPNDKLSAHKVVSIALEIKLPVYKNATIFGTNCNVQVSGVYESLEVTLNDGAGSLDQVVGIAEITTQSGDIYVRSKAASILGNSKYGKVVGDEIPSGDNKYILNTVTGNIRLQRIE